MYRNNGTVHEWYFLPDGKSRLNFIASMFIIPIGTVLNFLVIFSLLKSGPKLRSEAGTKFVINLAISDLIFCCITLPLRWTQFGLRSDYEVANPICRIQEMTIYWTFFLSLFSLTLISINRLILIVYNPIYHKVYTKVSIALMILVAWITSFALAMIPYLEIWGVYKLDFRSRSWCGIRGSPGTTSNAWPRDLFFILGFTLPGVTMIITYGLIWIKVIHQGNNFEANKSAQRNFKLFKLIVIIFGAFILCYFPNLLIRAILGQRGYGYVKAIGIILIWCNACINPIIYFAFNQEYRYALERMLGFQLTCKRSQPPSSDHTSESAVSNANGDNIKVPEIKATF